jgi:uncharacterized protein (DUF2147 family)
MRFLSALMIGALVVTQPSAVGAAPAIPDGTWLVSQRIAFDVFPCQEALCGRIAWLRNPTLRTDRLCGRTVIWGLTSSSPSEWDGGWFFDPENGATYNLSAVVETRDRMSARIYKGISLFGRTELLTRIEPRSLPGWCGNDPAR